MNNDKTTKKGHIRYSTDLKEYLKNFILGNKSDAVLWNAISRENKEVPNSTFKNAFNPNKDRLTINVVQSLLVFVIKKRIDNSDVLDKLNDLFARFCFEDFSKKDKASILNKLRQKTLQRFKFYEIDFSELLIFNEKILNEDYSPVQRYKGFDIKLKNIIVEVEAIKEKIEYKKIEKDYQKNKQNLRDNFIDFTDFINERTTDFIGRKNVSKLFKEFKDKNDSGYFILTGKPGMGKSSYLSFLTKKNNYIHHFINSDSQGRNRIEDVLGNLSFRIKEKYKYLEEENYIAQLLESVSFVLSPS